MGYIQPLLPNSLLDMTATVTLRVTPPCCHYGMGSFNLHLFMEIVGIVVQYIIVMLPHILSHLCHLLNDGDGPPSSSVACS